MPDKMVNRVDRRTPTEDRGESLPDRRPRPSDPAFKVKTTLELDIDLGLVLANYLLDSQCPNPALRALAHRIIGRESD